MSYKYEVHMSAELQNVCFGNPIQVPSIADAQGGFWINKFGAFTRDDDCIMWIPPSQILFVKKI